jgi:curved DNA-binding protein CbpA
MDRRVAKDDLYTRLGVSRDATPTEIKRAYRRASKRAHPDAEGGSPEKWAALVEAHDVLSDAERRRRYDETGEWGAGEPDNHQAAVMMRVVQAMAIVEGKLGGRPYASVDWPREIREIFHADLGRLRPGIAQMERVCLQWQRVAERAKAGRGKPNIIQQIALGKVRECGMRIEQGEREVAELTEALALIEGAAFDVEQMTMPQMAAGMGPTLGSWGGQPPPPIRGMW